MAASKIVSDDINALDVVGVTAILKTFGTVTPTALTVYGVHPASSIQLNFLTEATRDDFYKKVVDVMGK